MTILRIINRGVDREMYEAVAERTDIEHDHPLGVLMHGTTEADGKIQVAQAWESEDYARRWEEECLRSALRALGAPVDAESTIFELHHLVTP